MKIHPVLIRDAMCLTVDISSGMVNFFLEGKLLGPNYLKAFALTFKGIFIPSIRALRI